MKMIDEQLLMGATLTDSSVTQILRLWPTMPLPVLTALAVATMLERTVSPFRLCQCGCGESVHGKARLASPACRQRVSRQRRAIAATCPKQFNLVIQHEIPVTIPTNPRPKALPVPHEQLSALEVITVPAHTVTPFRDGQNVKVTGFNHGARRADGHEPYEVVFNYNTERQKVRTFKNQADAEAKLKIKIDWSEFRQAERDDTEPEISAFPNCEHFETMRREDATESQRAAALVEITNDDATKYVANIFNNLRIAIATSYAWEFERWAKDGIYPGAFVEYNGKRCLMKRFEVEAGQTFPVAAILTNPDDNERLRPVNPSLLVASPPPIAKEPELF